jgi:hypothetical protein
MGTHLVDSPHPLFIGRIVRTVWDLGDLSESPSRRLDVLTVFFVRHPKQFPIWPQARWGKRPDWLRNRFSGHDLILPLKIEPRSMTSFYPIPTTTDITITEEG